MPTVKATGVFLAVLFLVHSLVLTPPSSCQPTYRMKASAMGSAGSPGSTDGIRGNGTMGQSTPIGIAAAPEVTLYAGFWGKRWVMAGAPGLGEREVFITGMAQNYPNPFPQTTTITYSLAKECRTVIEIFDVNGRKVRTLVEDTRKPGRHYVSWDGRDANGKDTASGVYFYRMSAGDYRSVKKMVLIK